MGFQVEPRKQGETGAQYRGRWKREVNAYVESLNLQIGEPISYGRYGARFALRMIDKHRPQVFRRLSGDELREFLEREAKQKEAETAYAVRRASHDALYARPEAQAASSVRSLIEDHLPEIIDRLTPEQWIELHKTLQIPRED
jgi:hypothetical protein